MWKMLVLRVTQVKRREMGLAWVVGNVMEGAIGLELSLEGCIRLDRWRVSPKAKAEGRSV